MQKSKYKKLLFFGFRQSHQGTLINPSLNLKDLRYNEKLELVDTVPFWHNFGYVFHGPNKWHGMEKGKTIRTERRGIQINYVTFETDWKVE